MNKFFKRLFFIGIITSVFLFLGNNIVFAIIDTTVKLEAAVTRSGDTVQVKGTAVSTIDQYVNLQVVFGDSQTSFQNQADTLVNNFVKANGTENFDLAIVRLDPVKPYFWKIVNGSNGNIVYKTGSIPGTGAPAGNNSTGTITVNNSTVTSSGTNLKVSGNIVSTSNRSATLRVKYGRSANTMTTVASGNFFSGPLVANQSKSVTDFLISNGIQAGTTYYVQIYDANDSSKVFTGPLVVSTAASTNTGSDPQGGQGGTPQGGVGGTPQGGQGGTPQGGVGGTPQGGGDTTLENPLQVNSLWDFIEAVLGWVVKIGAVVVGVFFVISGFKFVAAQGNEEKLSEAKRGFVYTVIGAVLLLGAWTLATIISSTVAEIAR